MILYLGTSSLVKLYVDEFDSAAVKEWAGDAEILATCRVAYTEAVSAINARMKAGDISEEDGERVVRAFSDDWPHYVVVDFDEIETGRLIRKYGLRRFDAIHLSAALMIKQAGEKISLCFYSHDPALCAAASSEGLRVLGPSGGGPQLPPGE